MQRGPGTLKNQAIIVVPCFNEASRLEVAAYRDFAAGEPRVRFLFVNDGSRDDTERVLRDLAQANPAQMAVLSLPANQGKAEAVRQGLLSAMASEPLFVGYWDADLATPLDEIPRLMALLEEQPLCDLVMGARVKLLGRDIHRQTRRHYLGRVFATAASLTLRLGVYDTQCGAKLMRPNTFVRAALAEPFLSRWIFDVELLARLGAQSDRGAAPPLAQRVVEMPLLTWKDVQGSKVRPTDFFKAVYQLLRIHWRYDGHGAKGQPRRSIAVGILALLMLLQLLLHVPMLHLPPLGQHVWRQVVGHAAARNYFTEDSRFFWPRADIRLFAGDTGVIYHELPLTYWLTAKSYVLFGEQNVTAHLIPLLLNLLLIPGVFYLGSVLGYERRRSLWLAFFASFTPLFFFYAPLFEPNMLGLSFFVWGAAFLVAAAGGRQGAASGSRVAWLLVGAGVMLTLATLAKPTYLFFGLPLAGAAVVGIARRKSGRFSLAAGYAAVGAVLLAANALVIRHAQALFDAAPHQRRLHTPIGPAEDSENFASVWRNVSTAATKWFIEMNVGLLALPFFLFGAYLLIKDRPWRGARALWRQDSGRFWLLWCLSFVIFCCFFVERLADHDYYITATILLAAVVSSAGADAWMRRSRSRPRWRLAAWVFVLATTVAAAQRGYGRWLLNPQVPKTLVEQAAEISAAIPADDLVLIHGDATPIVYLYYLRRKGLSLFAMDGELTAADARPFKWLVARAPQMGLRRDLTDVLTLREVKRVGDFVVYAVEPKG